MIYNSEQYAFLFDIPAENSAQDAKITLGHKHLAGYKSKTIRSGNIVECEIYPIWNNGSQVRKARQATTREAQRNLNERNAKKRMVRLINTNFTEHDLDVALTYAGTAPDEAQARKDIRNYLRRVRSYRKKQGLGELKYIYVIEFDNGEGSKAKKRVHHHVIMSGMPRDDAEKLWGKGYANSRRLQPDAYGLEAIARYITKDPRGSKRWCGSRNLKEPRVSYALHKFTRRQVEDLAQDFEESAPLIFAKHFPDCAVNEVAIHRSDFVAGVYVYAKMLRRMNKKKRRVKSNAKA